MKRAVFGFIAGFIATLVFHQIAVALLHAAHLAPYPPWAMKPVPPFGVPSVISLSFWGGVWGAIMIPIIDRRRGAVFYVIAILFGAILPTLVAWFVVAPLKHQPMAGGWKPRALAIGPIVNGAWGFGTALLYRLLDRIR
jgi:hypothetical protein